VNAVLLGAVRAAIEDAICFHAVTNDPAATMGAGRRERMDGTFETVEDMRFPLDVDLKTFIVYVAAYFTSQMIIPL